MFLQIATLIRPCVPRGSLITDTFLFPAEIWPVLLLHAAWPRSCQSACVLLLTPVSGYLANGTFRTLLSASFFLLVCVSFLKCRESPQCKPGGYEGPHPSMVSNQNQFLLQLGTGRNDSVKGLTLCWCPQLPRPSQQCCPCI